MPSQNPTLTTIFQLPSPLPADPPDVPGDIKALADKVDISIPRIKEGRFTGQTTSDGGIVVTHNLGVVPDSVVATAYVDSASMVPSTVHVIAGTFTTTQFTARVFRDGQRVSSQTTSICWIAVKT